jgi:hypothetical protein
VAELEMSELERIGLLLTLRIKIIKIFNFGARMSISDLNATKRLNCAKEVTNDTLRSFDQDKGHFSFTYP